MTPGQRHADHMIALRGKIDNLENNGFPGNTDEYGTPYRTIGWQKTLKLGDTSNDLAAEIECIDALYKQINDILDAHGGYGFIKWRRRPESGINESPPGFEGAHDPGSKTAYALCRFIILVDCKPIEFVGKKEGDHLPEIGAAG